MVGKAGWYLLYLDTNAMVLETYSRNVSADARKGRIENRMTDMTFMINSLSFLICAGHHLRG